jgi:tripartite-type tricarboxylate transporter receptor subunit TctC
MIRLIWNRNATSTATFVVVGLVASAAALALAQPVWPAKPITYVVPYPPGGTTDILGRALGQRLSAALGVPVVVDNKPGATGTIGSAFVARAAPDGHTLLGTSIGPQAIVPSLGVKLPYNPVAAFEPVTLIGTVPHVLVVGKASPYRSVADLIAAAKAKPGTLTFASGGSGTILQMQGELLKLQAGIDMTHVPYKGDTPALQDVLAGHADLMFAPVAAASQHVRSGNLRALAVTSAERLKGLPDVPTMAEVGVPDFVAEQWQALYAPAGTPRPIIDRLQAEVARIIREPELMERLEGLGVTPIGGTPEQLAQRQREDTARWSKVISTAGIKPE